MKRASALGLCLLAVSLFPGSLLAAEPLARSPQGLVAAGYFFPSAANTQGAKGATFKTRMVLTNPGPSAISVVASLNPREGSGGVKTITLGPGETLVYGNFLQDVFAYTGGGGFSLAESTSSRPFYAVGEVYADVPNGRFSTPLVGMSPDDRVVNVVNGDTGTSMATGLVVDDSTRANFGCANMDGTAVAIRADIYNESSNEVPAAKVTLPLLPWGWVQQAVPVTGQRIRIVFTQLAAGGLYGSYCYGVNVNNLSNDGTLSPALYAPRVN